MIAFLMPLLGGQAHAIPINSLVPSNAYIVFDNIDWAWGGPCAFSGGCGDGTLAYQGTQGWALPSAADLAIVNTADSVDPGTFAELFLNNPGGNVPGGGGTDPVSGAFFTDAPLTAGSCATPYFSTAQTWCDATDGVEGFWAGAARVPFTPGNAEQLYVRSANSGVPEPGTWVMMLLGVGLIGAGLQARRRVGMALTAAWPPAKTFGAPADLIVGGVSFGATMTRDDPSSPDGRSPLRRPSSTVGMA